MTDTATRPQPTDAESSRQSRLVALVVAVAFFMQFLDGTIVTTSLPQMAQSFGIQPVAMSIGITIYMLTMAVFIPISGWLGDRYGARNVFLGAIAIFTLSSLACGLSQTLTQFVAARAIQGAGSALMLPVGRLIVLKNARKDQLVQAVALITWPALFAPVIGPVLGSFITTYASWHWNFLINIPLGIVGMALVARFVPDQREEVVRRLDVPGFILSSGGLVLLLCGLEGFADGTVGAVTVAALLAAGVVVSALAIRHLLRAEHPLLDLSTFKVQTFAISTLTAGTASRLAVNSTPFLLPLFFQIAYGFSPIKTGTFIFVYFLGNLGMKTLTTPLLRWFGFRAVLVFNGIIAAVSVAACALLTAGTPEIVIAVLLVIAGMSRSMQFTALNTIGFADINAAQRSSASTLSSIQQQVSMLLGVAVAAAALNISQLTRGGTGMAFVDFRVAFVVIGLIGLASALYFSVLPRDAGAEVSGHKLDDAT